MIHFQLLPEVSWRTPIPSEVTGSNNLQIQSDILSTVLKYEPSQWWRSVLQERLAEEREIIMTSANCTQQGMVLGVAWMSLLRWPVGRSLRLQSDIDWQRDHCRWFPMLWRKPAAKPACSVLANCSWLSWKRLNSCLSPGWRSYWSGWFFSLSLKKCTENVWSPFNRNNFYFSEQLQYFKLHLNYFLVFFAWFFQDYIGCAVTVLIFVWNFLLLNNALGNCAISHSELQRC